MSSGLPLGHLPSLALWLSKATCAPQRTISDSCGYSVEYPIQAQNTPQSLPGLLSHLAAEPFKVCLRGFSCKLKPRPEEVPHLTHHPSQERTSNRLMWRIWSRVSIQTREQVWFVLEDPFCLGPGCGDLGLGQCCLWASSPQH